MKFKQIIQLKDGRECILRSGEEGDGAQALASFTLTHAQTDNLLTYPEEIRMTVEEESAYLKGKEESLREVEIVAVVNGKIVGTAGIDEVGKQFKACHRADFGISIEKEYWGLGIGRALTEACIECAKKAGYDQIELNVVSTNENAIRLYDSVGFKEFGRNPRGFRTREGGYQELIYMRLEL